MNKYLTTLIITILLLGCKNPKTSSLLKEPQIDKRAELLSIVFRLAESKEYSKKLFPKYVDKIEEHFNDYKSHEIIAFVKDSLRPRGVSYDAVMDLAVNITNPPNMKPIIKFTDDYPDERWGVKNAERFIALLNQFYEDAHCEEFFNETKELYSISNERFNKLYNELDINWYESYYGETPKQNFIIINALGIGGCNYASRQKLPNDKENVYAFLGTVETDSLGDPICQSKYYLPIIVHEFNHSFSNQLVELHESELKDSGEKIYARFGEVMKEQAYGTWVNMYQEALVRANVIKYLKDNDYDSAFVQEALTREMNRGFVWTSQLVDELDNYSTQRKEYPSLNSYMPQLATFFDSVVVNIDQLIAVVNNKRPKIEEVKNIENGLIKVINDQVVIEIAMNSEVTILMSKYLFKQGKDSTKSFPTIKEIALSEDEKSILVTLNLETNKDYQMILNRRCFKSKEGYFMNENYTIKFHS